VLSVNVTGPMRLSRAVLPIMETQGGGAMERAMLSMATMPPAPADPDTIATAISWLASDEATNINGAALLDDGGWATA
jgi:NAD(P)-dependent dehydrogenase (short-subunit alcohol dehydrogenase family)